MDIIKCWNCQCHHPSKWEKGKYWCTEHQREVAPNSDGCTFGKEKNRLGCIAHFNKSGEYWPKDITYKLVFKDEQIMDLTNSDFRLNFIRIEPYNAKNLDETEKIILILKRDRYDKRHLYR